VKSESRDPKPDQGQAHRRGAVRGARARASTLPTARSPGRSGSQVFRPGKVPARIVDQRIGRDVVLDEAVNERDPAVFYGQGRRKRLNVRCAQPARDRSHQLRGRRAVDVYGGGRRPAPLLICPS